jgi:predicted dehydrogenase
MIRVGVIGIGMMGRTHLDVYARNVGEAARVVAVADLLEERRTGVGIVVGNIEGQARGGFDFSKVEQFAEGMDLIRRADVDLVDICVPTHRHAELARAALLAGKHVLVEKPLARTAAEARGLAEAARGARGMAMCGLCMRFWPGWTWLREAVRAGTYGKLLALSLRRLSGHPGGAFYSDGALCGGAILDLHVHDTDFVHWVLGMPAAVTSVGYSRVTGEPDHVLTSYHYPDGPLVQAEGGWAMAAGFGFRMQFTANFEGATAVYDLAEKDPLRLYRGGKEEVVAVEPGMGYQYEIAYFLECIARGRAPERVTLAHAARSLEIVEAERESIRTGERVRVG